MKNRPRVLIDSFHLIQALTGIRTYTVQLLSGLEELDQSEVEYIIYPNWRKLNSTSFLRGKVNPLKKILNHVLYFVWKQVVLPTLILFKRVDLVVTIDYLLPYMKFGARSITVFHDTFYWELKGNYNPLWRAYFLKSVKAGLDGDTQIVVTTNYIGDKVKRIITDEHQLRVVYQAPKELPLSDEKPGISDLPEGAKYFLHVGIFESRKNIDVLVRAFSQLIKQEYFKDFYLVLAGGRGVGIFHDDYSKILNLIHELEIGHRVLMPGFVPDHQLGTLYKKAFAYVFPSREEGFGIPVIEAMRSEIPVIISNQGALMEVANSSALIFDMDDVDSLVECMLQLKNEESQESWIKKGSKRAMAFSKDSFAETFHTVVKSALTQK